MIALAVIAAAEALMIAFLIVERRKSSTDFIALIDRLCQRVQHPAAAVLEHDEAVRVRRPAEYAPPAVEPDDDEGFWLSRDKIAEMTMKAELDERPAA